MESKPTKDQIFESAVDLFSQKGYSGTSIRDIARKVGIKESSIYNHFSGKKDILDTILAYYRNTFQSKLPARDELDSMASQHTDPADLWVTGIMAFLQRMPPLWDRISLILLNEMFLDEQCRSFALNTMFTAQKEFTEILLRDLYQRGMIPGCDFSLKAEQYVYLMRGMDMENRLRLLEGECHEEIRERMITQMKTFIKEIA